MDEVELVGGVLFHAVDPEESARALARLLLADRIDSTLARQAGLDPLLVEAVRHSLPRDRGDLDDACRRGAAWVRGRRTAEGPDRWEVVASLPNRTPLPAGLRRTTAETLIALAIAAEARLRVAAPYVDAAALRFLRDALSAASRRGVLVEIFEPRRSEPANAAISELEAHVQATGDIRQFRRVRLVVDAPFSHLKVMVTDQTAAYIGSANLTDAAFAGRNLELGVMVRGGQVATINALLDLYRERDG